MAGRLSQGLVVLMCWVLLSLTAQAAAPAGEQQERVYQVKAGFIYNIIKLVSWPEADDETGDQATGGFVLCLYRDNPLGDALNTLLGKGIGGQPIRTYYVQHLGQRQDCKVLVIPGEQLSAFDADYTPASPPPMLTITDRTGESDADSRRSEGQAVMIALVRKSSGIGFEINLSQAELAGLKLRSDLLKLARIIH